MGCDWTDSGAITEEHERKQGQGPFGVTSVLVNTAGATGVKGIFQVCESIEQEGKVPEEWAKSYTIPLYKGKGDVLMVDKQRGVRRLEQDMKV